MNNKDLINALLDCSAVLQRAHRIAEASDNPYVAQLIRQADLKMSAAIETLRYLADKAVAS